MILSRKKTVDVIILVFLLICAVGILWYNQEVRTNEEFENEIFLHTMELGSEEFQMSVWNVSLYEESGKNVSVRWWENNGIYYLFLPNSWKVDKLSVIFNLQDEIEIEGVGIVENGEEFTFSQGRHLIDVQNEQICLEVMYSSDIGTLFIETAKKNMGHLHESKTNADRGRLLFWSEDREACIAGEIERIACRGNASFQQHEKKSYSLQLKEDTDFLGGGSSKKWLLISNDADATLMRNMYVDKVGRAVNIAYMPDMNWVDLYIDGEYFGNYLLSEKIDIAENSVDIYNLEDEIKSLNADQEYKKEEKLEGDTEELMHVMWNQIDVEPECVVGGYLLELDLLERYEAERSGFISSRNQPITLVSPTYASYRQVEYIGNLYQEFEDAVFSENGYNSLGRHYTEYIDKESFIRYYLIDEITKQIDAAITSFFLFKDKGDSVIVAGPLWDYDKSICTDRKVEFQIPEGLYAATEKNETIGHDLWYGLYQHSDFRDEVKNEYWQVIRSICYKEGNEWITWAQGNISESAYMNYVRWHLKEERYDMEEIEQIYNMEVEIMRDFLFRRLEFLDSEWEDSDE